MFRILYIQIPALVIATILIWAPYVFAADSWSSNFMTQNAAIADFGGLSTTSSFTLIESAGEIQAGESTSTNFTMQSGSLYYDGEQHTFASKNWEWFDDETNETPSIALGGENVAPSSIGASYKIKLRVSVRDTASTTAYDAKFRLQFSTQSDFSDGGTYVAEQGTCTAASQWCYADGAGVDNATNTATVLSDPDPCIAGVGKGCGTHNESGTSVSTFTQAASSTAEYEFTIQESGSTPSTVYFFRLINPFTLALVPPDSGETYPSLLTGGGSLTFTIDGIEAASTTEGVTTDINTTSTDVPFGTLSLNTSRYGAQRLSVSTNATEGYTVFAFSRQGLLSEGGNEITPVSAPNTSPAGWASACTSTAGCFGYHAGDDVLAGSSNRFAANDTYAAFTSNPSEVAYSSLPATNEKTDMVYRILARNLQAAGSYSGNLVYIVTPVF